MDRFCAFGGDLIVVTGNSGPTGGGDVWRVKLNGTAQLLASIGDPVTQIPVHLEGVITLPVNTKYGPWSGTIIAGNENFNNDLTQDGRIWSITAAGVATPYTLAYTDPSTGVHHPVKPEDLDLIEGAFFGVNFADQRLLTAPASDFATFTAAGDILITQEYPCGSNQASACPGAPSGKTTGLYVVRFVGTGGNAAGGVFNVTKLKFSTTFPVQEINQWEHVTFAPTADVQVVKTTTTPSINAGQQASYSITVTANGPGSSFQVVLNDTLPNSGLTWTVGGADAAPACNPTQPFSAAGGSTLTCNFGTMAKNTSKTISLDTVTSPANCPKIDNLATVSSINDSNSSNNSSTATITVNCPGGKSIEIGPSSMEGAIKISNGDWVNGGYSFNFSGPITIAAKVTITGACLNASNQKLGTTDTVTVNLGSIGYTAVSGSDWKPTGDANSVLSWEGSVQVGVGANPTVCGGGTNKLDASKGAVYDATISGVPPGGFVTFRFKYRDPAAKGKPNTNCLDTTDPTGPRPMSAERPGVRPSTIHDRVS